jgi:hypothetical protein
MKQVSIANLLLLPALLAGACASSDEEAAESVAFLESIESQCGPGWDVQDVETYDGTLGVSGDFVARQERHVGYHVRPGCTGTLISKDLFISAGHCGYVVGDVVRFNFQDAPDGTARPTTDVTVAAVVEQENNGTWDYAIVRLNGDPGFQFGHASIAASDAPVGATVAIIQHPGGVPKVVHAGPLVDYASTVGANWFRHRVDTIGGSSGSGVLNTAGQLVGIHTNAGCNTGAPIEGNSAIRMSRLVQHSATLQGLVRGSMIVSDTNAGLAMNAVGGAVHGAFVQLHSGCTSSNPDCTWTYRDGMLLSDRDQTLAINAWGGATQGTALRLHNGCTPSNPDCTWTFKNGAFYSDSNPALAINASGGAQHGTQLRLFQGCPTSNSDCTWTYRNVMARSTRNDQLGMNAFGGAVFGAELRLHETCTRENPDCTFTIKKGQFISDRNTSLAVNAFGGTAHGTQLKLHNACSPGNPDCTWTLRKGMVLSDTNPALAVNAWGGAASAAPLRLHNACAVSNPDCTFVVSGD